MAVQPTDMPRAFSGLSVRLISVIVFVILAVEVVIYLPSAANFRANWLEDKVDAAAVATQVLDLVPNVMELPEGLTDQLLRSTGATAIAYRRAGQSQLIALSDEPMPKAAVTADLRIRDPMTLIAGALNTLFYGSGRMMRIVGDMPGMPDATIEVVTAESPLRTDLLIYSRNIFILSLIVASMTSLVIFVFVNFVLIRPIKRIVANMMAYREAPENAALIIAPGRRHDEVGAMERELAAMQSELFSILRQRRHLADLGLAVAKINHDLRNTLTSAQLLSDQVATLDDPKVQRLAPRLVNTLNRATGFAQAVLDYGREAAQPPRPQPVDLRALIAESALEAGLSGHPDIDFANQVPDAVTLRIDPDQMARVFINLIKNAREALEAAREQVAEPEVTAAFATVGERLVISVSDNGPGLPPRAKEKLFVAFEGSARSGGTGLGLAIARELTEAHGGRLTYEALTPGTRFSVELPASLRLA